MIVYEEHNYIVGISDKVTATEDLDNPDILRFKVINTEGSVLGDYFTSKRDLDEEEYAKLLLNQHKLLTDDKPIKIMYYFALAGDVRVVAEVYKGYVSIFASTKFIHQPFGGIEALRDTVVKEFGGTANAVKSTDN